jgi:hypothetical protein
MHFMTALARSGLDGRYAVGNLPDARGGDPTDKETGCYNQGAGACVTGGYKRTIKMPITTAHAIGIRAGTMKSPPRFIGATGTVLVTVIASVWLIILYIRH